ncbi:unnamed protein product [Adineta steineri]|uniref:Ubiquitin-like domain-containing protein n=1 Tax=Adineta steineri TaxID=433720 RepID=A0A818GDK5_9BILA|nr:unnamed protein product [Adineta steineri]CAF0888607.1 unnamed protein product [Adineta steineri]CAF3488669.1 unnamed protein product [Adineta steineri]CAF3489023.1 unnamed protein product [Adineta steineri]
MKARQTKTEAKPITITAERLSDNSRITFTISSDKTIKQLHALLDHHLPPLSSGKFELYSYQRGALIHFHPSSFKLDYFPVIFDQSVLLLKMDDRLKNNIDTNISRNKQQKSYSTKSKYISLKNFLSSKSRTTIKPSIKQQTSSSSSSTNITCLTILKQYFHKSSSSTVNKTDSTNILTY